jgi:hypothetical protein
MGKCKLCGEKAGIFRKVHPDCQRRHDEGEKKVCALALEAIGRPEVPAALVRDVGNAASSCLLSEERKDALLIAAWEKAAEQCLEDGILSQDEENRLNTFASAFSLDQDDLNRHLWWQRVGVAGALRELVSGKFPQQYQVSNALPFNFQPKERLVWVFSAKCFEERQRTQYVGRSNGLSIRIAKGVYYRTSAFQGNPVVSSYMHEFGTGMLALTDKHIYFHCPQKAFRVAYKKIVSFIPYDDGMGIHQEAVSSKPKVFVNGDGWSLYNLAVNLSQQVGQVS